MEHEEVGEVMNNKEATEITNKVLEELQKAPHAYTNLHGERWSKEIIEFVVYGVLVTHKGESDD